MWELIRANQRKSVLLFAGMAVMLLLLGFLIGSAVDPENGGFTGVLITAVIWSVMSLVSLTAGSSLLLSLSKAVEVSPKVHQRLFNVVEEMQIAGNLPVVPKIYIINSEALNAFAAGKDPSNAAIAVTAGLLSRLNRDELQGVIAHEMSHIMNYDTKFMTYAAVMLGSIVIISEVFLRGMFYSGSSKRYSSKSKGVGQAQLIILIAALVFALLAPIMARLLYFAISRRREYLADASAARLTRYPGGLASALEKISQCTEELASANKVTAAMFIANPLKKKGMKLSDLTSTHPPISERIRILRNMMYGANYNDYQDSYSSIKGKAGFIIPVSGITDNNMIPLREPCLDSADTVNPVSMRRKTGNIMMAVNGYSFLTCICGLKIKIPPGFGTNKPVVTCPKCGYANEVPSPDQSRK